MRKVLLALLLTVAASAQVAWPGQGGNAVGFTASPTWTGSFTGTSCGSLPSGGTTWSNATVVKDCTFSSAQTISQNYYIFSNVDFNAGSGTTQINGNHILFIGCRFQSNNIQGGNTAVTSTNVYFYYDSFVPLVSFYSAPPGYTTWPSAGAGANSTTQTSGTNAVAIDHGYEYGINMTGTGLLYVDHSDFWGYGNAISLGSGSTSLIQVTGSWMHDAAYPTGVTGGDYHTDVCPGYLNGGTGPNNVTVIGNTCTSLGNNQTLPFQAATGGYQNIYLAENYLGGQTTIAFCRPGSTQCTNSYLYGNVFGTDLKNFGVVYSNGSALGSGSVWACNTIAVVGGTTWTNSDGWTPNSGENGDYLINNSTASIPYSTTDQGSNTLCGIPNPSTLQFGYQASSTTSAGKIVTFSSTNTGNLSSISIALATGTQFSQTNNCGATLNSGNSCTITVKFAPTGAGPQTDTLEITDNTPGVTSPQLIPLAGIGCSPQGGICPGSVGPSGQFTGFTGTGMVIQ